MSYTAQNVIDAVKQDNLMLTTNTAQILDYVNRVQEQILRASGWQFRLSNIQYFITEEGQTDYWIGTTGGAGSGQVDTGLNLTDLGRIKEGEVFDRSNYRPLERTTQAPLLARLGFQDNTSRPGRPLQWRNDPATPNVLNIYPSPDNQNTYQPVPESPYVVNTSGGALAARTYYFRTTFVDTLGNESSASDDSKFYIAASNLAKVKSPAAEFTKGASGIAYDRWNVYVSTGVDQEQLQNVSPIAIGTDWTEPTGGLIAGAAFPTTNNLTPMQGYLIQFRYFKSRPVITLVTDNPVIPDDYKDVHVAGVTWMTAIYLKRPEEEIQRWAALYRDGLIGMVRDKNNFPKGNAYISPDAASVTRQLPTIESFDPQRFMIP